MKGWVGTLANVNVATRKVQLLDHDRGWYRRYLGGAGLAARLLYDSLQPGVDPLSPGNMIALVTGPVTGAPFPGVGRVVLCARSPLTGGWGESSMGGYLGSALKAAGYDGLMISGASESPVYLLVSGSGITLHDASPLWGHDTFETEQLLKERHGSRCEVISIGQAGENLVRFASATHRGGDSAGRCGMGALLGSKKVKAVVVDCSGEIEVADINALRELRNTLFRAYKDNAWITILRGGGTAWGMGWAFQLNDVPVRNWSTEASTWEEHGQRISGQAMEAQGMVVGRETCYRCSIACKRRARAGGKDGRGSESPVPEYESLGALGAMLMIDDVRLLNQANELCNRYGMDTISCGGTIAWAIESYEAGLLTPRDTGGCDLRWGDAELLLDLIESIAHRRGIGEWLANGSRAAAQKIGRGSEQYAIQVKGLELPMHHPRALRGMEISYATSPRGATHNEGGGAGRKALSLEERALAIKQSIDRGQINNSAVFCSFAVDSLSDEQVAGVLASITGLDFDKGEIADIGNRTWHLKRAFNLRHCGIGGEADVLPTRVLEQLPADVRFDELLSAYFHSRGLDSHSLPYRHELEKLGLTDVANDLTV